MLQIIHKGTHAQIKFVLLCGSLLLEILRLSKLVKIVSSKTPLHAASFVTVNKVK